MAPAAAVAAEVAAAANAVGGITALEITDFGEICRENC